MSFVEKWAIAMFSLTIVGAIGFNILIWLLDELQNMARMTFADWIGMGIFCVIAAVVALFI